MKQLKSSGFGEIFSTNWMKQISSMQIVWNYKIIFSSTTPMLFLKVSFIRAKDRPNLNIFTVALIIVCQMTQCIVLKVQSFYVRRSICPLILLSTRDKRIAITFQENQRLNIGNQYQKYATQCVPGIIEKFDEPHNITPHHIDETVKEREMKYQQIVQALDRIRYLIGKQGLSYQETQKAAANSNTL